MRRLAISLAPLFVAAAILPAASRPAAAQILTAAPTFAGAADKLLPAEIKSTFSGKHHEEGTDIGGNAWVIEAAEDGTLQITSGAFFDAGRMRINGGAVCVSWAKAWEGRERCFHYAHHGKELASYGPDGKLNSTLTVSR